MNILSKEEIIQIANNIESENQIKYIESAFLAYSDGSANVPPVGYLGFDNPPGDVHIKYGYIQNDPYYVIKIASGFYNNIESNLPVGNGMMLAFNAQTGMTECLLQDEGYLTDLRTGLAGAIAGKHLGPKITNRIGIIGTGVQARLQLTSLAYVNPCKEVLVWGRDRVKAEKYKNDMQNAGFNVEIANTIAEVPASCNLIVTTTPSKTPLLKAEQILPGTHITAMGSDADGKQELDPEILGKAVTVACDSISQCADHGEVFHAIQAGLLNTEELIEVGQAISNPIQRDKNAITVADLTGIATQDIKITSMVLDHQKLK